MLGASPIRGQVRIVDGSRSDCESIDERYGSVGPSRELRQEPHSRKHGLDGGVWETRIAEPQHTAFLRWRGDTEARNAVYANRNRLHSAVGKQSMWATGGDRRAIVRS